MRLKLIEGPLSYNGIIRATAKNPIVEVEDEAVAALAMASGYFINLDANVVSDDPVENGDEGTEEVAETENLQYGGKLLSEMNKSELETFAAYRDVSLKGISKKAEIIAALREALPAAELEGPIYYGSPTMTDLQR